MTTARAIPKITCYACGPKDAIYFPPGSMRKAVNKPGFKDYCTSCRRKLNKESRKGWGLSH